MLCAGLNPSPLMINGSNDIITIKENVKYVTRMLFFLSFGKDL